MSSANRGYERHKADYYKTPVDAIEHFIPIFIQDEQVANPKNLIWFDPCAGGLVNGSNSVIEDMSYPAAIEKTVGAMTETWDIREDSPAFFKGDYLTNNAGFIDADVIITNPPFSLAVEIIQKALRDVKDGGYVIMLQRLNFLGSDERKTFWQRNMPKTIYVHSKRMNFITPRLKAIIKEQTGKTPSGDSIEYAHFVWKKEKSNKASSVIKVI